MVTEADAITLDELANVSLFLAAGRPITNRTGLTGKFTVHLEYAPPEGARLNGQQSDATESTALSIFTALHEQLGLKLESSKGPGKYLIVDHVDVQQKIDSAGLISCAPMEPQRVRMKCVRLRMERRSAAMGWGGFLWVDATCEWNGVVLKWVFAVSK